MANLSDLEIFDAALQAGFTPDQAVTMTAIALAESGGNSDALNPNGEYSVGLWQINTAVHGWDPAVAEDPLFNARMAFEVSGGGADITRWTVTHQQSGSRYLAFRERALAAASEAGHTDAVGQWEAPENYHADGVGAAPADSTSQPLFEVGEIPDVPDVDAPPSAIDPDPDAAVGNAFDTDGDGIFDAVEEWMGEDLLPDASLPDLAGSAAPSHGHSHGHSHDHGVAVDPSQMVNGQLSSEVLVEVDGGDDSLAAGAPANSWQAMVAAAEEDGVDITFSDAYRPLADQQRLARDLGLYGKGGLAAVPGTSNHGLGLAVDVNRTPETMAWLDEHAAEYGWIADVPGEPWHFNYRLHLDPDPGRDPVDVETGPDRSNAFDRDGDGVFDSVETWIEGRGGVLSESVAGVSQASILPPSMEEDDHEHSHEPDSNEPHAEPDGNEPHAEPDGNEPPVEAHHHDHGDHDHDDHEVEAGLLHDHDDHEVEAGLLHDHGVDAADILPPLSDDEHSQLSEIFSRFDSSIDVDSETVESIEYDPVELRRELADFVSQRDDLDSDQFVSRFDDLVSEHGGVIEFDDVIGLFDFDH